MLCLPTCSFKLGWRPLALPARGVPQMRPRSASKSCDRIHTTSPTEGAQRSCVGVPGWQFDRVHFVFFPLQWPSQSQGWVLEREAGDCVTGLEWLVVQCASFLSLSRLPTATPEEKRLQFWAMWSTSSCMVKRSSPKKGSFFQDTRASAASRAVLVRCQDKYRKRGLWGGLASAEVCHEGAQKSDNSWRISSGACRVYITFAVRIEAVGKTDAERIEKRFPLRRGLGDTTQRAVGGRHGLTMTWLFPTGLRSLLNGRGPPP